MSLNTDVFEPKVVLRILKGLENSVLEKEKFEKTWNKNVGKRTKSWSAHKDNACVPIFQLEWEAEVIEYVDYIYSKLSVHGNAGALAKEAIRVLDRRIPLFGPRFSPPSYLHSMRREATPAIKPQQAYTSALTVIHPVFYPPTFTNSGCPKCNSRAILWDGWNGTGARMVYGIRMNERAIGYQLRCKDCKNKADAPGYCFATTNHVYWEKWEHWKIPRSIPYFLKRAAVTHELFDMIVELRPISTSAGLAECLKQLHLLEHRQRMLDYLSYYDSGRQNPFRGNPLLKFSAPTDESGYGDSFITSDLITDLYLDFIAKARKSESIEYCQTRTAKCVSLDNTFKSSSKATIVDSNGERQNPMKGGILSAINEEGEGLAWRFCMSASPAETRELLENLGKRHDALGVPRPDAVIVDNCCQVRRYVQEGLGHGVASVCLDVYHFIMRYGAVIYKGTKNPRRPEVLSDIRNSIIKTPAKKNQPATYWTQREQEVKIVEAYNKWLQHGNIWSAAASKVHIDQLAHVQKGCLARPREDISMDGSRIEGSHKGWNSLQRSQPSGIEVYTGLAFDFFLRRNIRIASSRIQNSRIGINCYEFIESTYSSHHIRLVNYTAEVFNSLRQKESAASKAGLHALPTLPQVDVCEVFGLVESMHSITFGGLVEAKPESDLVDSNIEILDDIDAEIAEMDHNRFIQSLGIDESLMSVLLTSSQAERRDIPNQGPVPLPITSLRIASDGPPESVVSSITQSQKRKERALSLSTVVPEALGCDDTPPDPKRRRTAAPFSPSTQAALGPLSSSVALGLDELELNEAPSPERQSEDIFDQTSEMDGVVDFIQDCEPTNATMSSNAVLLPNTASTSSNHVSAARAFFRFQTTLDNSVSISKSPPALLSGAASGSNPSEMRQGKDWQPQPSLEMLRRPLPLPDALLKKGLTRSQLLFSIGTSIDPRALRITGDDEFYLFMDMRAEFQWTSFAMTAPKWASAAKIYNMRLEDLAKAKKITVIKKSPRALMDKLSNIEAKISERIFKNNYLSKKNTETFWRKHCSAVPTFIGKGVKAEMIGSIDDDAQAVNSDGPKKKRKDAICTRCKSRMYTGDKTLNHRKGYCADGVAQKAKPSSPDSSLPEWPQPQGIFSAGKLFDPLHFLFAVRDLYERVMEHTVRNPEIEFDYTLEDEAFSQMLTSRTTVHDGHSFFLLYDLEFTSGNASEALVSEIQGRHYLRMDCL